MTTAGKDAATEYEDWGQPQSRTVTWHDPASTAARGLAMPGIDYLKAMIARELPPPPMAVLMQFDLVDVEPGKVVFTCRPDASMYNPNGAIHGGLVCTILDSVAGLALHSTLPVGKGYTSIEIKVNYLKPVRLDAGPLSATGTVVKSGARVGFTEGVVTDAAGKAVATATSTLLIFDL
ncbi:MAG TPA: PaaI family thioesterase [Mycobacterium sp.]|jgi:uncharacterized protein (TIGR00369 family)|uniref:PaaI family thioesterase n=1 Tax=Mycobacterium sp. TaxID=1785 RepID=UPI002F3E2955